MTKPARKKWWDDVISVDTIQLNDYVHLLWGDRVRILDRDTDEKKVKVFARGATGWIPESALGAEPVLELYFIDVGQGDGILVVTPEGHHLVIDGGHQRSRQQTGKSAADFVDWKFHKEYLYYDERSDPEENMIRLDAMIASHADEDHYGGLRDLIDPSIETKVDELNTEDTMIEAFYHPGLCPQETGTDELGEKDGDYFVQLLEDRAATEDGLTDNPQNAPKIRGRWKEFLQAVVSKTTSDGKATPITRLSHKTKFLPGFADIDDTSVKIRVLAPIEADIGGKPGLKDLGREGENKNGHSIALRLDYGERRFILTGDLNHQSQTNIMEHYDPEFQATWEADVVKACHHGSHHVDYEFLKGVGALVTVFSSGDANTYDHPRAWVLGASALSGRVIDDPKKARLKAPLIYSTEVARSLSLASIYQLREYREEQEYGEDKGDAIRTISGEKATAKWRTVLHRKPEEARDLPPISAAKVMRSIIYGLVNVRSDGKRILVAVRNEGNASWAYETIEADEIKKAYRVKPDIS